MSSNPLLVIRKKWWKSTNGCLKKTISQNWESAFKVQHDLALFLRHSLSAGMALCKCVCVFPSLFCEFAGSYSIWALFLNCLWNCGVNWKGDLHVPSLSIFIWLLSLDDHGKNKLAYTSYPGEMLPTARTIKEMLPIRYGRKKPQSWKVYDRRRASVAWFFFWLNSTW